MDGWMDENIYLPTDERVASPESGGAERAMCGTLCVSNLWLTWLHISIEAGIYTYIYFFIILLHQEKENERGTLSYWTRPPNLLESTTPSLVIFISFLFCFFFFFYFRLLLLTKRRVTQTRGGWIRGLLFVPKRHTIRNDRRRRPIFFLVQITVSVRYTS
jgi:hypothetical protein